MPKDYSLPSDAATGHSPVGGLSDALYAEMAITCQPKSWTKSPIGGLSLAEFLRIAKSAD